MEIVNILLNGQVNDKMVETLIEGLAETGYKRVYLNSTGGSIVKAILIIDMLDNHNEPVEVIGFADVQSAAFDILYRVKTKKRVLPGTMGMVHMASVDVTVDETNKPYYPLDRAKIDYATKWIQQNSEDLINGLDLSKKEMKLYRAAEPVYLMPEKMCKLFNEEKS